MINYTIHYISKFIKRIKLIILSLFITISLFSWNYILWEFDLINENSGYIHLVTTIITTIFIIIPLLIKNIINITKNKKERLFFIFYFLFFIFYFLFFIFYFFNLSPIYYMNLLYTISYFSLFIIILIKLFTKVSFIKNYLFLFLALISDIFIKYSLTNNFIEILTTLNINFYNLGLYWIPLFFTLIQLYIEAYSFYKKEKPKWIRYNRIKKYK